MVKKLFVGIIRIVIITTVTVILIVMRRRMIKKIALKFVKIYYIVV